MFKLTRRSVLSALGAASFMAALPGAALAGHSAEAEAFIQKLADESVNVLSDQSLTEAQKIEKFDLILSRDVDMGRVGRFVLGRYWRGLPEDLLDDYLETYQDYLIHSNAARLSAYSGGSIQVTTSVPDARGQIIVKSHTVSDDGSDPINIDWRLRENEGELKIIDIVIAGISMALTQRDEFSAILQRSGGKIDPLMQRMQTVIDDDHTSDVATAGTETASN